MNLTLERIISNIKLQEDVFKKFASTTRASTNHIVLAKTCFKE